MFPLVYSCVVFETILRGPSLLNISSTINNLAHHSFVVFFTSMVCIMFSLVFPPSLFFSSEFEVIFFYYLLPHYPSMQFIVSLNIFFPFFYLCIHVSLFLPYHLENGNTFQQSSRTPLESEIYNVRKVQDTHINRRMND